MAVKRGPIKNEASNGGSSRRRERTGPLHRTRLCEERSRAEDVAKVVVDVLLDVLGGVKRRNAN